MELGKAVHLALGSEGLINAKIIGFRLNFEDIRKFELIFSNRYQKKNGQKFLKDLFNSTSQSKKTINANKYTYNRAADKVTEVSEIMQQQLVAAINNIVNKTDQTVLINGSGINIGGSSNYQMRLVDNMIAMTDDGWKTAKLAIGLFATESVGTQWGVNAEMLAGSVIIGNKLILQNPNDDGYMMFQIDETGAWLYNAQFVLQDGQTGGLIMIDPKYGIVAGTKLLFDTNGTTVTPEFMDQSRTITYDSEGMPQNANFFLNINDGSAYFRGKLVAQSGNIGGYTIENSYLHSGKTSTYVALNGGTSVYADYAIWAGAANPSSAPFWVKKDGSISAKNGTFSGTLSAARISGTLTGESGSWLEGCGIRVGKNSAATKGYNFYVDSNGNVWMQGNLKFSNGSITWDNLNSGVSDKIDSKISAGITASENKLTLFVQQTKSDLAKDIAKIELFAQGINLSVTNGSTSSSFKLTSGSATLSSGNITFTGFVTFTGLSGGTTTINGACIKTGTISADRLDLTGAITFSDLSSSAQRTINNISDTADEAYDYADDAYRLADRAYDRAVDAQDTVAGWCYRGTTYIDGASIMTGTVMASKLVGGEIALLDSRELEVGSIIVSSTNRGYGIELQSNTGGIRINPRDDFRVDAYYGSFGITSSGVVCGADCVPQRRGYSLGDSSYPWNDVYASNGSIITSDLRMKNNVEYGLEKYSAFFDKLQPISYLLDSGTSGRRHIGLGA